MQYHFVVRAWAFVNVTINQVVRSQLRLMKVYHSSAGNDTQARQEVAIQYAQDFPNNSLLFCEVLWLQGALL